MKTHMENVDNVLDMNGNSVFGNMCISGGVLNAKKVLYETDIHIFDIYYQYSSSQHKSQCDCGEFVLHPHAVRESQIGEQWVRCILCDDWVNLWNTIVIIGPDSKRILSVTTNGSYILPNGIVVLVESDIESYINNRLIFNNPNEKQLK